MGYLTTITIYNDHLGDFKDDPKQFGEDILGLIDEAFHAGRAVSKNDIIVQPSRHANDHTLYLHWGNYVGTINPYSKEMEESIKNNPDLEERRIKVAEWIIKKAKEKLKESKK